MWVGAYGVSDNGIQSGAVYIFDDNHENTWTLTQKLIPADGSAYAAFGWSLDTHENISVVSAYSESVKSMSQVGAVYTYVPVKQYSNHYWTQHAKILAIDGYAGHQFGWSVAAYGSTIAISARGWNDASDNNGANNVVSQGKVYCYDMVDILTEEKDDDNNEYSQQIWIARKDILPPYSSVTYFGTSISLSEKNLIVGAYGGNMEDGTAFIYSVNNWWEDWENVVTLYPNASSDEDISSSEFSEWKFGYSVALCDHDAVVGAISADGVMKDTGAIYCFTETFDETALGFPVTSATKLALMTVLPIMFVVVFMVVWIATLCRGDERDTDDDKDNEETSDNSEFDANNSTSSYVSTSSSSSMANSSHPLTVVTTHHLQFTIAT